MQLLDSRARCPFIGCWRAPGNRIGATLAAITAHPFAFYPLTCAFRDPISKSPLMATLFSHARASRHTPIAGMSIIILSSLPCHHHASHSRFSIPQDDTLIMHGGGKPEAIAERCEMIREQADRTTSEYEKEKLQVRNREHS